MFRSVVALLFLWLPLQPRFAAAQGFSPEQREQIVRIVREALRHDPSILREALQAAQADEARREQEFARNSIASHKAALSDPADPVAGNPRGDITIVEFFDLRCPYCRRLEPTMARLLDQDRGVRLIYKDLPILGPPSVLGARALLAAQKQDGYERLRTAMMDARPDITLESLRIIVQRIGLDWGRLQHEMEDPAIQRRIDDNLRLSRELGITGTPAMVVGSILVSGAVDLEELKAADLPGFFGPVLT
jgi:protein-disulfide isomerase